MISKKALKAWGGMSVGGVMVLLSWIVAYWTHQEYALSGYSLSVLVGLLGITAGWLVGILASPVNTDETKSFAKYASIVASFFSGYVLAQLEPSLREVFGSAEVLVNPIYGIRVSLFSINFLCALITVYVYRIYLETN